MNAERISRLLAGRRNLEALAAVVLGARSVEDVAATLERPVDEVEVAVQRLLEAGLVRGPELPDATPEQEAVLRNFVEPDGRLADLPARHGRRRLVLEYAATRFEPGVAYAEPDVNDRLRELHDDYATLRRYLVDEGLLRRERGVYTRA
jgi:hypothetical protein